jgi:hypothetical protein
MPDFQPQITTTTPEVTLPKSTIVSISPTFPSSTTPSNSEAPLTTIFDSTSQSISMSGSFDPSSTNLIDSTQPGFENMTISDNSTSTVIFTTASASESLPQTTSPHSSRPIPGIPILLGRWNFEEAEGTVAVDTSLHNLNGTLLNGAQRSPQSKIGFYSLACDATMFEGVALPEISSASQLSLLLWMQSTSSLALSSFFSLRSNQGSSISLRLKRGIPLARVESSALQAQDIVNMDDSAKVIADGLWHHVAMVLSGNSTSIYIDGVLEVTGSIETQAFEDVFSQNFICQDQNTLFYDGLVDDVRLYYGALSAIDILSLVCKYI